MEDFFNTGPTMVERCTCHCVIDALMISIIIGVNISMHWVNTHEGRGSRAQFSWSFQTEESYDRDLQDIDKKILSQRRGPD